MTEQLELPLWEALRSAQMMPEQIDFEGLLAEVEEAIAQVSETEQLRLAGDAFLRMAEVYTLRSEAWMEEWEQASRDPVVERGFFADVVRQTMAVDLSDLMEPARSRQQRTKPIAKPKGSIAAPVDKAAVLAMVDQLEAEDEAAQEQSVLVIAHSEDVVGWTKAIAQWLQTALPPVSIVELSYGLEMPWAEVWLGVLFGGFQLEQRGEFYESPIWVKCSDDQAMTLRQDGQLEAGKLGLVE